jgi:DNA-binding NarL/FixJ family response regulator
MSPSIAREIVTYFARGQTTEKKEILTNRQTEIMELMIEGNTYSSIAQALLISAETVKSHIKQIYTNLHVNDKAQAIAKYMST